jgi:hypothetical protein
MSRAWSLLYFETLLLLLHLRSLVCWDGGEEDVVVSLLRYQYHTYHFYTNLVLDTVSHRRVIDTDGNICDRRFVCQRGHLPQRRPEGHQVLRAGRALFSYSFVIYLNIYVR